MATESDAVAHTETNPVDFFETVFREPAGKGSHYLTGRTLHYSVISSDEGTKLNWYLRYEANIRGIGLRRRPIPVVSEDSWSRPVVFIHPRNEPQAPLNPGILVVSEGSLEVYLVVEESVFHALACEPEVGAHLALTLKVPSSAAIWDGATPLPLEAVELDQTRDSAVLYRASGVGVDPNAFSTTVQIDHRRRMDCLMAILAADEPIHESIKVIRSRIADVKRRNRRGIGLAIALLIAAVTRWILGHENEITTMLLWGAGLSFAAFLFDDYVDQFSLDRLVAREAELRQGWSAATGGFNIQFEEFRSIRDSQSRTQNEPNPNDDATADHNARYREAHEKLSRHVLQRAASIFLGEP